MAKTAAERAAAYRERHLKDVGGTGARLNMIVSADTKTRLERMAKRYGVTQRAMLERAIEETEQRLMEPMTPAEHAEYTKSLED